MTLCPKCRGEGFRLLPAAASPNGFAQISRQTCGACGGSGIQTTPSSQPARQEQSIAGKDARGAGRPPYPPPGSARATDKPDPAKCSHNFDPDACYCACPDGPCEHDWQGWREFDDGRGGARVCSRCGMGAMSHDLWVAE